MKLKAHICKPMEMHTFIPWSQRMPVTYLEVVGADIRELFNVDNDAFGKCHSGTVSSTSDYTLCNLYRFYFKGISANIELQV
jgi:hypothetical protein